MSSTATMRSYQFFIETALLCRQQADAITAWKYRIFINHSACTDSTSRGYSMMGSNTHCLHHFIYIFIYLLFVFVCVFWLQRPDRFCLLSHIGSWRRFPEFLSTLLTQGPPTTWHKALLSHQKQPKVALALGAGSRK